MKDLASKKRTHAWVDEKSNPTKKCKQDRLESKKENKGTIELPFVLSNFRYSPIRNFKKILQLPLSPRANVRYLQLLLNNLYQEFLVIYQEKNFDSDSFSPTINTNALTIAWCDVLQNILYYYCHLVKGEGNSARNQKPFESIKPFIDILLEDPSLLFYYSTRSRPHLRIIIDEETHYTVFMSLVRIGYYDAFINLMERVNKFCLAQNGPQTVNALMQMQDRDEYSLLHTACKQGNEEIALFLLKSGEKEFAKVDLQKFITFISVVNKEGLSLLTTLCRNNASFMLVKKLIEKAKKYLGPNSDQFYQFIFHIDSFGFSPLSTACLHGHDELVALLLEYAYPYDKKYLQEFISHVDNSGFSPLASACKEGHEKIITLLVHAAKIAFQDDDEGFFAFLSNKPRGATRGASPTQHFCLKCACKRKDGDIVDVLIKIAENHVQGNCEMPLFQDFISRHNSDNLSPLTIACNYKNYQAVILLITNIKKAFAQNFRLLIKKVSFPEDDGFSSLNRACRQGNAAIVETLLEFYTNCFGSWQQPVFQKYLTQKNDSGIAPLHAACLIENPSDKKQQSQIVTHLFTCAREAFQDKNDLYSKFLSISGNGTTVLHQAVVRANPILLLLLLHKSAEILGKDSIEFKKFLNARDDRGNTPLNSSAYLWTRNKENRDPFLQIAEALLSYGANTSIRNEVRFSPDDNGLYRMIEKGSSKWASFFSHSEQPIDSISKSTAISMRRLGN